MHLDGKAGGSGEVGVGVGVRRLGSSLYIARIPPPCMLATAMLPMQVLLRCAGLSQVLVMVTCHGHVPWSRTCGSGCGIIMATAMCEWLNEVLLYIKESGVPLPRQYLSVTETVTITLKIDGP